MDSANKFIKEKETTTEVDEQSLQKVDELCPIEMHLLRRIAIHPLCPATLPPLHHAEFSSFDSTGLSLPDPAGLPPTHFAELPAPDPAGLNLNSVRVTNVDSFI
ncbi:hypothetical protein CDAR_380281 [Caerostris darwini]|uniref:Uncharacterized protein n=1 Tax=Caerostris darwini TaxID=1538125 RepID=A0AAV4TH19_9ARAC|nr:hypothetical protein CDAR_380281 [Caerostris darwini]